MLAAVAAQLGSPAGRRRGQGRGRDLGRARGRTARRRPGRSRTSGCSSASARSTPRTAASTDRRASTPSWPSPRVSGSGASASSGSCASRHQQKVELADGTAVSYDELVVATGMRPRRLPGSERISGVHVLAHPGRRAAPALDARRWAPVGHCRRGLPRRGGGVGGQRGRRPRDHGVGPTGSRCATSSAPLWVRCCSARIASTAFGSSQAHWSATFSRPTAGPRAFGWLTDQSSTPTWC
ncbi:MAG: hypothetical protein QOH72_5729 [Solirubrobacteraceae bacterium]|nr:hypothetical protein [Solirubrobacteraceae bacterium]